LYVTHTERDFQAGLRERVANDSVHAEIRSRLSDYLDGSLPAAELDSMRQHLDSCSDCQAFWRTLLRLINTTGQLPRRGPSPAARQRIQSHQERSPSRSA
jgi:anti-sigma factor RsiW